MTPLAGPARLSFTLSGLLFPVALARLLAVARFARPLLSGPLAVLIALPGVWLSRPAAIARLAGFIARSPGAFAASLGLGQFVLDITGQAFQLLAGAAERFGLIAEHAFRGALFAEGHVGRAGGHDQARLEGARR